MSNQRHFSCAYWLKLAALAALLSQCTTEKDVIGHYSPIVDQPGVQESLIVAASNKYFYEYQDARGRFRHQGGWQLETDTGYTYLVMQDWKTPRRDCLNETRNGIIVSFEIDGDNILAIKDLLECGYAKEPAANN